MNQPSFEVIAGCMFAGKTEELIRRLRRAVIARQRVQVFKPAIDRRYHDTQVVTHEGRALAALAVADLEAMDRLLQPDTQVVGIDESQFFGPGLPAWIEARVAEGRRVIVAGLDLDYLGAPYGTMPLLLAMADEVTKLTAVCVDCGGPARRSYRLTDGHPPGPVVGGAEAYEAVCRVCYAQRPPL